MKKGQLFATLSLVYVTSSCFLEKTDSSGPKKFIERYIEESEYKEIKVYQKTR